MQVAGKVWGSTQTICQKPLFEVHRIEINAGGVCSMHQHRNKFNAFFVESGTLQIIVRKNAYELTDVTTLNAGDYCEVPPGEYHKFEAVTNVVAFEYYWSELDHNDIVREDHGHS